MNAKLVMFKENGERKDFDLIDRVTVGRRDDCDIRIPLAEVSRQHTEFLLTPVAVKARDMGSANGTYVNNKLITEVVLAPGDHVVIGPVVFTVQIDGKPHEIKPVKTKLERRRPVGKVAAATAPVAPVIARDDEIDPISLLEQMASGSDMTAIDPFPHEEED